MLDSPVFEAKRSILAIPKESGSSSPKFTKFASPYTGLNQVNLGNYPKADRPPCHTYKLVEYIFYNDVFFSDPVASYVEEDHPNKSNLCEQVVSGTRPSMSMSMSMVDLLNQLDKCMTEQHAAGESPFPSTEVSSEEFLEHTERFFSDTHDPPSVNEKDLFCSLLKKDTTPFTIPIVELNNDTIVPGKVGSPGGITPHGGGPPIISRKDSFTDFMENLKCLESSKFL
jgi:hypothetical protein